MSSEVDGVMRALADAVKEVTQEGRRQLSNMTAEATGHHLESEARTEQRELESPEYGATADDWYEPGDAQALPLEAQSDGPWPFGRPDLPLDKG